MKQLHSESLTWMERRDQVVVMHSFNCVEYPVTFLALNRLGAIASPSSPMFNATELSDQIVIGKVHDLLLERGDPYIKRLT